MTPSEIRPPLPPFTHETAVQKIRMAEDAWNSRDPQRVSHFIGCATTTVAARTTMQA